MSHVFNSGPITARIVSEFILRASEKIKIEIIQNQTFECFRLLFVSICSNLTSGKTRQHPVSPEVGPTRHDGSSGRSFAAH